MHLARDCHLCATPARQTALGWGRAMAGATQGRLLPPCTPSPVRSSSAPSVGSLGSLSWWYFSCLARIRSILWQRRASSVPVCLPLPQGPPGPLAEPLHTAMGGSTPGWTTDPTPVSSAPPTAKGQPTLKAPHPARDPSTATHCRLSCTSDFFSAWRWKLMLFRMLALNSAKPLPRHRGQ